MNEVKRYGNTWCEVTERIVFKHDQQDGDYVKLSDYATLQQQLTATTNSLTNAQEALKSAGIEADTVQAGVMELVSRMNQVVAENAAFKSAVVMAKGELQEHYGTDGVDSQDSEGNFLDACIRLCDAQSTIENLEGIDTPATDAYLNAVRADAIDEFGKYHNFSGKLFIQQEAKKYAERLRSGNAGKDGV